MREADTVIDHLLYLKGDPNMQRWDVSSLAAYRAAI